MIPQSKGKLFLGDERGMNRLDWYRSYNTFNFGRYQSADKVPFSDLYVLNDDTLAGGYTVNMRLEEDSWVLLLPVVGNLAYRDHLSMEGLIAPGQAQLLSMPAGSEFKVTNPYERDLINYLQLWIRVPSPAGLAGTAPIEFDLIRQKNELIEIFRRSRMVAYIGQFDGRGEAVLPVALPGNAFFAFVIDGQFEVQYRLMHARDGLVLWDLHELEMEALSNQAVILILELPAHTY